MELTFTLDLEEHRPNDSYPKKYPDITRQILDFLEQRKITATIFVLGRLAEDEPELIKEISKKGHEIGFHTYSHIHLTKENLENFKQQSMRSKSYIEDLIGHEIVGFRAPAFSLTNSSLWALDVIKELGFIYSSSVLPANNPINGFPGAPREPFLWSNELIEIPAPIAQYGPITIPYLGGIYLRYLPVFIIKHFLNKQDNQQALWMYCHPHDFDHEESYYTIEGTSIPTSLLLWFNRKNTFKKIEKIFSNYPMIETRSFIEQINDGRYKDLKIFTPLS